MNKFIIIMPILFITIFTGCIKKVIEIEKPIYIPSDRKQYVMTNEYGVVGWFVPTSVHAEMLEALIYMNEHINNSNQ